MSLLLGSMAAFLIGPNQSTSSRGAAAALPCVWPKRDVSGFDQFDLDLGISVNQGAIAAGWFLQ